MSSVPAPVETWHRVVADRDRDLLASMLADDVVFRSPAVHTPQQGPTKAFAYLSAALAVLGPTVTYHREWTSETSAVLEFTATLDGLDVHGVDMLSWNDAGQLTDFTVMVRPFQALVKLIELMAAELGGAPTGG